MALPFAFLISPLERVVRSDGTRILVSEKLPTKREFKLIKVTMTSKLILLSAFWAIWSFFYRSVIYLLHLLHYINPPIVVLGQLTLLLTLPSELAPFLLLYRPSSVSLDASD
jgi:hypothetical protein